MTTFTKLQVSVTRTEKYFCVSVLDLVQVATGDILKFYPKFSTKYFMLEVCNIGVVVVNMLLLTKPKSSANPNLRHEYTPP